MFENELVCAIFWLIQNSLCMGMLKIPKIPPQFYPCLRTLWEFPYSKKSVSERTFSYGRAINPDLTHFKFIVSGLSRTPSLLILKDAIRSHMIMTLRLRELGWFLRSQISWWAVTYLWSVSLQSQALPVPWSCAFLPLIFYFITGKSSKQSKYL